MELPNIGTLATGGTKDVNGAVGRRLRFILGLLGLAAATFVVVALQAKPQPQTPVRGKDKSALTDAAHPKVQPLDLGSAVQETAKGTRLDDAVLKAANLRDEKAAQELVKKYHESANRKDRGPGLLDPSEITEVLVLDYNLPEYHFQLAESYFSKAKTADASEDRLINAEFAWQHLEWLRLNATDRTLDDRLAEIRRGSPPRPAQSSTGITKELLAAARKTFQAGMAFHIDYPANDPIEFKVGDNFAMNMPILRIRYIRSPEYPPHGCRVVAYMLVSRGGGKPEPKAMHRRYEPSVFPTGMLVAGYATIGKIELNTETRMFIHVESLYEAKDKPGTIISNTLAIPVVAKK